VFLPVAFFPGAGQIYKQFGLTIAFSIAISTFLALTLAPSLSALLLAKPEGQRGGRVFGFFRSRDQLVLIGFNWDFDKVRRGMRDRSASWSASE